MGEFIDKAKGAANQAVGKAKVKVGRAFDSLPMMLDGAQQEVKGKALGLARSRKRPATRSQTIKSQTINKPPALRTLDGSNGLIRSQF